MSVPVPVLCKAEEIIVDTTDYNSDEAIESEEHLRITLEDSGGEYQTYHHSEQQTTASTIGATTTITTNNSSPPRNRNNNNNSMMSTQTIARLITASSGKSGTKNMMENEKRMRREIANSNERRRMQSINAGFQSLRSLLPHHEGEKLSKAAILQQTAQYIIELEREKTHLLSQNSQLKRFVGQHEVGGGGGGGGTDTTTAAAATTTTNVAIKKRKFVDNVITVQTISDSSDEGLGSMSPEPVTLLATQANGQTKATTTAVATAYLNVNSKELNDLKSRLESERSRRTLLEERLRQLERQIYPPNQYVHREVIEHTDNLRDEDIQMSFAPLQVVELESIPNVGQAQLIVCHSLDDTTMTADEDEVISGDLITNVREEVVIEDDSAREYVELSPHLHPILDAAIKAEPKVEVERINSGLTNVKAEDQNVKDNGKQGSGRPRITSFVQQNTSRQNLETIVEAIRHLEGDHLFSEHSSGEIKKSTSPTTITVTAQQQKQELPLALKPSKPTTVTVAQPQQQRKLPIELAPYLQLKKHSGNNGGNNTVTIVSSVANATLIAANNSTNSISNSSAINSKNNNCIGTSSCNVVSLKTLDATTTTLPLRIKGITSVKQPTRPGVIVTKNP